MIPKILRCENCENNKFFMLKFDKKLMVECVNCGVNVVLEENLKIKDVIQKFEKKESMLRWYDIYMKG